MIDDSLDKYGIFLVYEGHELHGPYSDLREASLFHEDPEAIYHLAPGSHELELLYDRSGRFTA